MNTFLRYRFFPLAAALILLPTSGVFAQMSPEDELATLRPAEGFDVSLFASEPMITNPSAIDIDTHGRVWVAEIQWYRSAAKDDPPADKIKVLEDTDGDGRADKATVFADHLFCPMSVCVAGDKIYVATSPDLWVYEDKNGDLAPDGPPARLLTGFGGRNHDHGAHSLILGPDHKWWMAHGDTGFDVRGTDSSHIQFRWGAMLRGELDGSRLEIVARNFRNPYELCVDSFGEAYCSDNDNDGNESVRICWIMDGGDYGWFGRPPFGKQELDRKVPPGTPHRESWHFRGYVPGYVPATLVTGFGSPCGICIYEEDHFGSRFQGVSVHADAGPQVVRAYRHENDGYGKTATSEDILTSDGDRYFRPDDVCVHPDGSIYVADWYDGGVGGHAYNDPDRGRIFVLRPQGKAVARSETPGPYQNVAAAIDGLKSPNLATQYLAREKLISAGDAALPQLNELLESNEDRYRARALWLLARMGHQEKVEEYLSHPDAKFRALAGRVIRRSGNPVTEVAAKLAGDETPPVRREALLTMKDLPPDDVLSGKLIEIASTYDGSDRYLLEAVNIALMESKPTANEEVRRQLAESLFNADLSLDQVPLLKLLAPARTEGWLIGKLQSAQVNPSTVEQVLRHLSMFETPKAGRAVAGVAANTSLSNNLRQEALRYLAARLPDAWSSIREDEILLSAVRRALAADSLRDDALRLIEQSALTRAGNDVVSLARNVDQPNWIRQRALAAAIGLELPAATELIREFIASGESELESSGLKGAIRMLDAQVIRSALSDEDLRDEHGAPLVNQLMESTGGALLLLPLVEGNELQPTLADRVIAKAVDHADANVRAIFENHIPADKRTEKLGESITAEEILRLQGDARRGRQIFYRSSAAQCANCHAVHGQGSTFGPDLSNIGQKYAPAALLETILQPSKAIAPEYIPHVLVTTEGQVHLGFLVEKADQHVTIKDEQSQLITIPSEKVDQLSARQQSLMPELVLRDVTAQDAADMLEFLIRLK